MMSSFFSRQDLLKTFMPLSESGKAFLEVMLVNPKTSKPEGRGYFNDIDFLLEACSPHIGRYNFCLSNFAYPPDLIPTRGSCNQFDRTLLDGGLQDKARAHSLSVVLLFKPDLVREMGDQAGSGDQFLNIVYQVDAILGRLGIKSYSLDYFLTGITARFCPAGALQRRPLARAGLDKATRRLVEVLEKQLLPAESKRFALGSAVSGKAWDPLPGLPGLFAAGAQDTVVVTSSGALQPGDDATFAALLDEVLDAKASRLQVDRPGTAPDPVPYASNIQGLSQGWSDAPYEPDPGPGLPKSYETAKEGPGPGGDLKSGLGGREGSKEVAAHLQSCATGRWRWPLVSGYFNKVHQGSACGELLLLQCDPFASELAFDFLLQGAETFAKEGTGQVVVFSKKRGAGDIALAALCRHYKANPLESRQAGRFPDPSGLSQVHGQLFPSAPHVPACGRAEGLDSVLRYLEHDYLVKQKKHGGALMPLAILLDNLEEFWQESDLETAKRLSAIKQRLREINGTLWVTQLRPSGAPAPRAYLALADHLVALDHDGSLEAAEAGRPAPRAGEWEAGFHLDLSLGKLMHEISLAKVRFQAHGSHRVLHGHYVYYRNARLFREIHPPSAAGQASAAAEARASTMLPVQPQAHPGPAPQPGVPGSAVPARGAGREG